MTWQIMIGKEGLNMLLGTPHSNPITSVEVENLRSSTPQHDEPLKEWIVHTPHRSPKLSISISTVRIILQHRPRDTRRENPRGPHLLQLSSTLSSASEARSRGDAAPGPTRRKVGPHNNCYAVIPFNLVTCPCRAAIGVAADVRCGKSVGGVLTAYQVEPINK